MMLDYVTLYRNTKFMV